MQKYRRNCSKIQNEHLFFSFMARSFAAQGPASTDMPNLSYFPLLRSSFLSDMDTYLTQFYENTYIAAFAAHPRDTLQIKTKEYESCPPFACSFSTFSPYVVYFNFFSHRFFSNKSYPCCCR